MAVKIKAVKIPLKDLARALIDKTTPLYANKPAWGPRNYNYEEDIYPQARMAFPEYNKLYPDNEDFSKYFTRDYYKHDPKVLESLSLPLTSQPAETPVPEQAAASPVQAAVGESAATMTGGSHSIPQVTLPNPANQPSSVIPRSEAGQGPGVNDRLLDSRLRGNDKGVTGDDRKGSGNDGSGTPPRFSKTSLQPLKGTSTPAVNAARNLGSSASIFTKKGGSRLASGLSNFLGGAIGAGGRGLGGLGLKTVNGVADRWQRLASARSRFKTPSVKGAGGKAAIAIFGALFLFMLVSGLIGGISTPGAPTGEAAPIPGSVGIGSSAPLAIASATSSSQLSCITSMSAEDINNFFDKENYYNFQGTGQIFVNESQKYKINPALVIAIGRQESNLGQVYRGKPAENFKNAFGLMQSGSTLMRFDSWADGISVAFRTVNSFNCPEVECIGQKYAPLGAGNDPNNLNQYWVSGVQNNFNSIPQSGCIPVLAQEIKADLPSGWPTTGQIFQGPFEGFSHKGQNAVDITNNASTPIYSTLSGVVTLIYYTDPSPGIDYGVRVIITNKQTGAEVLFAHLIPNSNSHLTKDQPVVKGTLIGLMDSTGFSTGNHLHYEIRGSVKDSPLGQYVPGGTVANGTNVKQTGNPNEWTASQ